MFGRVHISLGVYMCVCVCAFPMMHSSGKFVPLCMFTQCVKDCIIVYVCTLCVYVCADKVSPHISMSCLQCCG